MNTSEWISVIALIISSGGFAINLRNWFMSGPKLHLSLMPDALSMPDDGQGPRVALIVINRGTTPTMLTHMVVFSYPSGGPSGASAQHSLPLLVRPAFPFSLT